MFILNHHNTIEHQLVEVLNHRIHDLNIPNDIRQRLIENLNKFSNNLIQINSYTNARHHYVFVNDEEYDEDSYIDDENDDDTYSDENDMYDDLENVILDQIEMEHDIDVFNHHTPANNDNNNNNNHYSSK
jgi:hypothetical protein